MKKIIFILLLFSEFIFAQTAILDTNTIIIGDQINLKISVELDIEESYNWPEFTDTVYKKIEIISKSEIKEIVNEKNKIITQNLIITSFDSGSYYLPPFIFNLNKKTEGIVINVTTYNINDSSSMMDITKTKIGVKKDLTEQEILEKRKKLLIKILIILSIIILTLIIYYLIKKYKKEGINIKPKIKIPAHITALNKLEQLKKQKLWQKGEVKEYYSIISLILREYIENRFNFIALELPTSDILKKLDKIQTETKDLEFVLLKADFMKYAKGISMEEENIKVITISKEFITVTKIEKNGDNE